MKRNLSMLLLSVLCTCAISLSAVGQEKKKDQDKRYVPKLSESIVAPPSTPTPKKELKKGLKSRDRALLISNFWIRDPYITMGPDGYYYLTGTISANTETRAKESDDKPGVRIWRSRDLIDWEFYGKVYTPELKDKSRKNQVWAPELHWLGDRWALIHCPGYNAHFVLGPVGEIEPKGPWTAPMEDSVLGDKHDPSLYQENGKVWMIWTVGLKNATLAPMNASLSGWTADAVTIFPSGERYSKRLDKAMTSMGHEGAGILKIGDKYVYYGTGWSTDEGRRGSYNLYYATADSITGPYGPRRFLGRFLGHGNLFQDTDGKWWCTAFANANVPPITREGIQTRDLSDNAYTINQCGTTIVPIDIRILPDGDIEIKALDPDYAIPGPDEAQKF